MTKSIAALALLWPSMAANGCLFGGSACDDDHGRSGSTYGERGDCAGPSSQYVCSGGEGHYYWREDPCPQETTCRELNGFAACVGADEGASCLTHQGCLPLLRCVQGICSSASVAQHEACDAAPTASLDGDMAVTVEVTIGTSPGVMETLAEPVPCAAGGGEALVHLAPEAGTGSPELHIGFAEPPPAELGGVALHAFAECTHPSVSAQCLTESNESNVGASPTLLVRTAALPVAPTTLRLSIQQR